MKQHHACLVGPGGSGKTAHAIAYAHGATYPFIVFLRGDAEGLEADLRALSWHIAEPIPTGSSTAALATHLYRRLQQVPMLFIIDNCNADPTTEHFAWLPPSKIDGAAVAYHCLLTSRRRSPWHSCHGYGTKTVSLPPFEKEDATKFLQTFFEKAALPCSTQYDEAWQQALCEALDDIPLALYTTTTYLSYHHRLHPNTALSVTDLLATHFPDSINTGATQHYPHTLLATWLKHLNPVHRTSPAALQLLFAIAYLAPHRPIPFALLSHYQKEDLPPHHTSRHLQVLEDYALVTLQDEHVTMLSIMQRIFVWWLSDGIGKNRVTSLVADERLRQELDEIKRMLEYRKLTSSGVIIGLTQTLSDFIAATYRTSQRSLIWSDSGMLEHSKALLHASLNSGKLPMPLLPIFYASLITAYMLRGQPAMLADFAELITRMLARDEVKGQVAEVTRTLFVLLLRKANANGCIALVEDTLRRIQNLLDTVSHILTHPLIAPIQRFLPSNEQSQWQIVWSSISDLPAPLSSSLALPDNGAFPLLGDSHLAEETRQLLYPGDGPNEGNAIFASIFGFASRMMDLKSAVSEMMGTLPTPPPSIDGMACERMEMPERAALLVKRLFEKGLSPTEVAMATREMHSRAEHLLWQNPDPTLSILIETQIQELTELSYTVNTEAFKLYVYAERNGSALLAAANHSFALGFYDLACRYYEMASEHKEAHSRRTMPKDIYYRWVFCHLMLGQPHEANDVFRMTKLTYMEDDMPNKQTSRVCLATYFIAEGDFKSAEEYLAQVDLEPVRSEAFFGFNHWSAAHGIPWVETLLSESQPCFSLAAHQLTALLLLYCEHKKTINQQSAFEVPHLARTLDGKKTRREPKAQPSRETHPEHILKCYQALRRRAPQPSRFIRLNHAPLQVFDARNMDIMCRKLLDTIEQETLISEDCTRPTLGRYSAHEAPPDINQYQSGLFSNLLGISEREENKQLRAAIPEEEDLVHVGQRTSANMTARRVCTSPNMEDSHLIEFTQRRGSSTNAETEQAQIVFYH